MKGTESRLPTPPGVGEPRLTSLLPPLPFPVPARAWGLCTATACSGDRRGQQHPPKTCDIVDAYASLWAGESSAGQGHEAGRMASQHI